MRRLLCLLLKLYPRRWRKRYADEFTVLIEDSDLQLMDVTDVLRGAIDMQARNWTFGRIIVAFTIVGLLVGLAIAAIRPRPYVSIAVLEQSAGNSEDTLTAFRKALNGDFDKFASEIHVINPRGSRLLEVSFRSRDANQAHSSNQALVQKLIDVGNFGVVQPPSIPPKPIPPMYGMAISLGISGGLLLGATAALWHRFASRSTA